MMRALRSWCSTHAINLDGRIFPAGYSEGGYATMAAQREIETLHAGEFAITASAPAAGPYDLSGTMLNYRRFRVRQCPIPTICPFSCSPTTGSMGWPTRLVNSWLNRSAGSIPAP
ncbi:MAG: hypothetical protein MZW92_06745 [Comamonadaceae bacterium]|nr:hypothetical protein [Comamonadaceae bacterium]